MYSMVLFIVDRSFSGFFGSGHRATSAVDNTAAHGCVRYSTAELNKIA